jgi:hypothetical protein
MLMEVMARLEEIHLFIFKNWIVHAVPDTSVLPSTTSISMLPVIRNPPTPPFVIHITIGPFLYDLYKTYGFGGGFDFAARLIARASLVVLFPISNPQPRSTLTTLGVSATVSGTRMKMNDLWIAYARASCVARPREA